jgi:hypothetical protein
MRYSTALSVFAVVIFSCPSPAQDVVSVQAGLINHFEGSVFVNSKPLPPVRGRFHQLAEGTVLGTTSGKAEILLTPRAFIWVNENSTIRIVSTDLTNARVEVVKGSAVVGAGESPFDDSLTVLYRNRSIRIRHEGMYRIDCDPFLVRVNRGAVVLSGAGDWVWVKTGNTLNTSLEVGPEPGKWRDDFGVWAVHRAKMLRLFSHSKTRALMAADRSYNEPIAPSARAGMQARPQQ